MGAICIDCHDGKHHACPGWTYVETTTRELIQVPCTCTHHEEN